MLMSEVNILSVHLRDSLSRSGRTGSCWWAWSCKRSSRSLQPLLLLLRAGPSTNTGIATYTSEIDHREPTVLNLYQRFFFIGGGGAEFEQFGTFSL